MPTAVSRPRLALLAALFAVHCAPGAAPRADAGAGDPSACGSCHPGQARAFATSRHAHAAESPVFVALRARAAAPDRAFCDDCHTPRAAGGTATGLACETCHTAVGNRGVENARLLVDPAGPVRGPFASPVATPAHAAALSDFVRSADLCGTCHEVRGAGAFVETPYSEWTASGTLVRCADCHMSPAPGAATPFPADAPAAVDPAQPAPLPPRALGDHAFVGPDGPRAAELLARAATLSVVVVSRDTTSAVVEVTVHNQNPAHALPSGARFAREVWLEVAVRDGTGATVVVSGGLDARGAPLGDDPARVDLGDRITHRGVPALAVDPESVREVRAIAAGASQAFRFTVPLSAGSATVAARLRFRPYSMALLDALGLADTPDPITDVAAAEAPLAP